ncbi:MAG: tandem-95 repeat protein, partial [Prevotella sp.]
LEFDITPVNDPVETGTDRLATLEDEAVTTTVAELLANDTDVDGSVADFVSLGAARNGEVHIDDAGTITFTPDADYAGMDAGFEYIVQDSEGLESTGWVEVTITGVNDAPLVAETHLDTFEDTVLNVDQDLLDTLFTEADGDNLSITSIEAVEGGTIHEASGMYSFRPDRNFSGEGKIRLTVTDNMGGVAESIVSLDILAVDDPADMGLDTLATTEEQPVTVSVAELLAAGSDTDGTLSFSGLGESSHGTASLSSGEITFLPDTDYYGNEAGFSYRVTDATGGETTAAVTVEVTGSNDPPVIIANSLEAMEDTPIVFNQETISKIISDPDGDNIVLSDPGVSGGGTISESGGIYTFTPTPDYHGPATLSCTATDLDGATVRGRLDLDILSVDDPTSFGTDAFTTQEEQPLITSVSELMANDTDTDGSGELQFAGLGAASHGQVQLEADGSVEFTPDKNYFGEDAGFAYNLYDSEGDEATGWVTVKVSGVNDRPEITGNRILQSENESLTFSQEELEKFIFDPDADLLSLDVVTNVESGRMELRGGVYTFIPDADFYGEASFEYLATDSEGLEVTGKLHLGVTPVNDLPMVDYSSGNGIEDNEILFNVADLMDGTTDVEDGTSLRFGGIDSSVNGDVYVDSENIAHFVPYKDYFGSGFFRYRVLDSEGGISPGYVGVDITGVNDVPVALDDEKILAWSNNSYENVFAAATFLDNDYDVDGDPLTITAVDDAEFGTVSIDSAGNIHYTASSDDWVGVDSFTYDISDSQGGFAEAVAKIDVKLNTSPDACSEILMTGEDVFSYIAQAELLANDSDINGDTMYISEVDQAEHCNVQLLDDGRIMFTPELNYNNLHPEPVSFRYTVTDGISDPVTAIAIFDIDPVNDAPLLRAERISGAVEDNSFSFLAADLLGNDSDVEMDSVYETDSIAFDSAWGASNGTLTCNDADGRVYYNPNQNFNGVDTFNYSVVDSLGAASVIQSEIYVTPINDAPVVDPDIGSPAEETIRNYYSIARLLSNDFDVDGDSLSISDPHIINGRGSVKISGGNLAVTPSFGEDKMVIGYTVSDGHGGETESRLTLPDIIEHNYAPTFSGEYSIGWKN